MTEWLFTKTDRKRLCRLHEHVTAVKERVVIQFNSMYLIELNQGRRQEFFQGRALGGSRGGLPSHFSISRGGAQPRFLVASMVKMNEFSGQGGPWPPLPMPAYALELN